MNLHYKQFLVFSLVILKFSIQRKTGEIESQDPIPDLGSKTIETIFDSYRFLFQIFVVLYRNGLDDRRGVKTFFDETIFLAEFLSSLLS